MKILLTNDDGIDAAGLEAMWNAVRSFYSDGATEIVVVAPDRGRSECGHSISGEEFLTVKEIKPGWFSVSGTPVECVRVAVAELAPDADRVFSGINAGANLGVDLMVSGTFAAARESAIHGRRAMAISHYRHPDVPQTWDHSSGWLSPVFEAFEHECQRIHGSAARGQSDAAGIAPLWNVNLPAIDPNGAFPPLEFCDVDHLPLDRVSKRDGETLRFESDFHGRPRRAGTDVDLCFAGKLTVSRLKPL